MATLVGTVIKTGEVENGVGEGIGAIYERKQLAPQLLVVPSSER